MRIRREGDTKARADNSQLVTTKAVAESGGTHSDNIPKHAAGHPKPQPPPRRGLASTSSWRVRGAPTWAWVSPAREAGRGAVGSHDPPSPSPSHTHISPALPSLGLCLDVRGYCSRRFHVQSFGHVFQVLIKLYGLERASDDKPQASTPPARYVYKCSNLLGFISGIRPPVSIPCCA